MVAERLGGGTVLVGVGVEVAEADGLGGGKALVGLDVNVVVATSWEIDVAVGVLVEAGVGLAGLGVAAPGVEAMAELRLPRGRY